MSGDSKLQNIINQLIIKSTVLSDEVRRYYQDVWRLFFYEWHKTVKVNIVQ